jgi:hypothetical protein
MDVLVLYKRGQRSRADGWPGSVLGNGLLERARATSLALLGLTAAVGLAIVALAVNQGWPLVAGSSIPQIPPQHQDVGKARIAPGAPAGGSGPETGDAADGSRPAGSSSGAERASGDEAPAAAAEPAESTELVVSPSTPTNSHGGHPNSSPKQAPPDVTQPQQAPQAPPAPPASTPSPAPAPNATEPAPPAATASESPDSGGGSYVPPWSHGKGHAYGRSGSDELDD